MPLHRMTGRPKQYKKISDHVSLETNMGKYLTFKTLDTEKKVFMLN